MGTSKYTRHTQLEQKRKDYNSRKEELIQEHIRRYGAQELAELEKELAQA